MKRILTCAPLIFMIVLLASCSSPADSVPSVTAEYIKISAEQAKERIDSGDEVIIVDVRTAAEFADGHIEGAVLIPNESILDTPPELLPDIDAEILIYCRSGNRSAQAANKLIAMGYTKVYDFGGIIDWPYDIVTGEFASAKGVLSSFTSIDLEGNTLDERIFSDHKITMVNIWATFCGPCIKEMPDLGELNMTYSSKGFQVVGIVVDVVNPDGSISDYQVETAREVVSETGANYLHLLPSEDLIESKLNKVFSVPETIFVDSKGNQVGESYIGSKSYDDWAAIIESLLSEVG